MSKAAMAAGFATVNPSTGEEIETFSYLTPAQTEKVVAQADKSFQYFASSQFTNELSSLRSSETP